MKDKHITIKIDFLYDLSQMYKKILTDLNFDVPEDNSTDDIIIKYYHYKKRRISPRPRIVRVAKDFIYPDKYKNVLKTIKGKIINGEDLSPYQSRRYKDSIYNDKFLYEWGIQHLHLGDKINYYGLINRTGDLLYCRFDHNVAYFLNIMPHNNWTKKDFIEILHNNWPSTISLYKFKGLLGIEHEPTESEREQLRKSNVNSFVKLKDGTIYGSLGGGYATSGQSIEVIEDMLRIKKIIIAMEKTFINKMTPYLDNEEQLKNVNEIVFNLMYRGNCFSSVNNEFNISFHFNKDYLS